LIFAVSSIVGDCLGDVSEMTRNVSSWVLNPTHSLTY